MFIRSARLDDATAATDVLRRSITELCEADHGNDEVFLARWLANKTPENVAAWIADSHVFVAEGDGVILGVAAVTSTGQVTLNYVAPEARFTGVSKALIRAVESRAFALGCQFCTLRSTKTAAAFYEAAGYRDRGDPSDRILVKPLGMERQTRARRI